MHCSAARPISCERATDGSFFVGRHESRFAEEGVRALGEADQLFAVFGGVGGIGGVEGRIAARFARPVLNGETLTLHGHTTPTGCTFTTLDAAGRPVLAQGVIEIA